MISISTGWLIGLGGFALGIVCMLHFKVGNTNKIAIQKIKERF